MPTLFDPIRLGALELPNRILMAPLTRGRGTREHVPTPIMAEYYAQRAGAGLIITEATGISQEGLGWPYAPGIWNQAQVEAWKPIVKAVHDKGGRIALQLWHMGYLVHPSFLGGEKPVSSSVRTAPAEAHTYDGKKPYGEARALREDEIPRLLSDYENAAKNAVAAGFDGVQIHSANGYLLDEFLRDGANTRTDRYGGSIENRVRLVTKVAQTVAGVVGADRTGIRFSPNGPIQGVDDSDPHAVFGLAAEMMARVGLAYIELREPGPDGTFGKATVPPVAPTIKKAFGGPVILNCDYDGAKAEAAIESGEADAIAFGRPFIANPDLPERLAKHASLNKDVMATWYSQGPEGYVDYPALDAAKAA
ncbi:alkene reductase [Methylobacterium brachythecii]|uniref:2,4-dienoyl-CoA reductase-like NADH-dependent reductase (Old Yellow Enzyme family) n=1 Tax=Methylobacterium brachythecii TaxID=1176177 RepID=A0A7W6AJ90_9HYPH|nr:alkene reductase [Methylobacterium brachythecii]MBB3904392.1 2,4-dienoyl-CoA reductase-like NADH-dependent reductase (Old Yellow Enzyme family) [Methylobacterium brachythecii]GLS43679.1 alkene reductase [Methylobacterium brachythecii]